ncbi:MAG: SelT/SelW/SelH family protein [Candidatus Dadabacteria bacterium]|nr:MAG: SelT/SelW/SelH family protein [Candidatus Dadabacteria bacterium]
MASRNESVIRIRYCPRCNWLPRATWVAQELLQTFADDVGAVSLEPGEAGEFRILIGDDVVWDRRTEGPVPEIQALKRSVRDRICPERELGHVDRAH